MFQIPADKGFRSDLSLPLLKNDNNQGEYYLPDVVKIYVDRGEKVAAVLTPDVEETHGINNVQQLKGAEQIILSRQASNF